MAYRKVDDTSLSSVADAIRSKGGTSDTLIFPDGFVTAISAIHTAEVGVPEYTGPYDITPSFSVQTLSTAKRLMQQDVTIRKIPQYEVSNDSSGYTLIIGDEYYNAQ